MKREFLYSILNLNFKKLNYILLFVFFFFTACRPEASRYLTVGAYTAPREALREINRLFEKKWKAKTGEKVYVQASYLGSGAQSRAVVDGFEADVVVLSLDTDIERIEQAGLMTHNWRATPFGGILTHSLVVFAVRRGNPKKIQDWDDLIKKDIKVLTPNPKTSGGAQWNVLAAYGAAKRGKVEGFSADEKSAGLFLKKLLQQVVAMDKGARESILTFERGLGDVALSYEHEVIEGQINGQKYEKVIPSSTILIENVVALVDKNIATHQNRDLAEAYYEFLYSDLAQYILARHGFRPLHPKVKTKMQNKFPSPQDVFSIRYFGGWQQAIPEFFGEKGIFTQTAESSYQK
ncbi:MAG: sulfate ABC transporter substrate-binding protein [Deltaproteobacteria bacterium]|nr:sulfate ABC transporter substrate-binding protein [Deltaproteobacteria bacterium]